MKSAPDRWLAGLLGFYYIQIGYIHLTIVLN